MGYADKLNDDQQNDAAATGIAFGWELGSILTNNPVCVAACEKCDDVAVSMTWPNDELGFQTPQLKMQREATVWQAFRVNALMACCEHFLDYMAYKGIFVLPTERSRDYGSSLVNQSAQNVCDSTGIAFGVLHDGSMVGGCEFCGYAVRAPRQLVDAHGTEAIAGPLRLEMGKASEVKTCAHYFRWLKGDR